MGEIERKYFDYPNDNHQPCIGMKIFRLCKFYILPKTYSHHRCNGTRSKQTHPRIRRKCNEQSSNNTNDNCGNTSAAHIPDFCKFHLFATTSFSLLKIEQCAMKFSFIKI